MHCTGLYGISIFVYYILIDGVYRECGLWIYILQKNNVVIVYKETNYEQMSWQLFSVYLVIFKPQLSNIFIDFSVCDCEFLNDADVDFFTVYISTI